MPTRTQASPRDGAPAPDAADSRKRIHAAALPLFARYGYEGVTLQMIADAVGLHKSSLFHHYRGKLELAREVLEDVLTRVVEIIRPLAADDPPSLECMLRVADDFVDHLADEPEAARLIVMVTIAPDDSDLNIPVDADDDYAGVELFTILWDWLERAKRAGAIRPVNVRQAIFNIAGAMLYYPAAATELRAVSGPEPFSPKARRNRKEELHALLKGLLEPGR